MEDEQDRKVFYRKHSVWKVVNNFSYDVVSFNRNPEYNISGNHKVIARLYNYLIDPEYKQNL